VHAVLHQILDDAVRRGIAIANVAASASPPRHEAPVVKAWSTDEVRTFLATARSHRLFPAFAVLIATGLTRGELVGLRWADIDLDSGTINVRRMVTMIRGTRTESEPTSASRRSVTIAARTTELLQAH
jgi:integrase